MLGELGVRLPREWQWSARLTRLQTTGISMVALRNCPHIGRLGEYVLMAADRDMIATAYVNSQTGGNGVVVPWGGIEGRFTPTPLAFAAPSGFEWHILVDITASVMPEGKIRDHLFRGAAIAREYHHRRRRQSHKRCQSVLWAADGRHPAAGRTGRPQGLRSRRYDRDAGRRLDRRRLRQRDRTNAYTATACSFR